MSTIRLEELQPRDVVPAVEADARIAELMDEIDDLRHRVRDATVQLRSAEERATSSGDTEMSQSAQLTVQFVEDLVATNRERIREIMTRRYVWVGERLAGAEAEAQVIRDGALAELSAALRTHGTTLTGLPDHGSVADIISSIAWSAPEAAAGSAPEAAAARPAHAAEAEPDRAPEREVAGVALPPVVRAPERGEVPPPPVVEVPAALAAKVESATAVDDVVESAVQAVLRALTEPQASAPPADSASPEVAPAGAPAHLASIDLDLGDDDAELGDLDAPGDALRRADQDFWGGEVTSEEHKRSRVRPRDLLIVMVALLAIVLVVLLLVG